jgi:hypothetical protein
LADRSYRFEDLWRRVPRTKPLSVGVVLLDLVPAAQHRPDLFAADNHRRQKLSPLIDRINDRYGRCSIGFGLFPSDVRRSKGMPRFIACRRGGSFDGAPHTASSPLSIRLRPSGHDPITHKACALNDVAGEDEETHHSRNIRANPGDLSQSWIVRGSF